MWVCRSPWNMARPLMLVVRAVRRRPQLLSLAPSPLSIAPSPLRLLHRLRLLVLRSLLQGPPHPPRQPPANRPQAARLALRLLRPQLRAHRRLLRRHRRLLRQLLLLVEATSTAVLYLLGGLQKALPTGLVLQILCSRLDTGISLWLMLLRRLFLV